MYEIIRIPGIWNLVPTLMHENGPAVFLTETAQKLRVFRV